MRSRRLVSPFPRDLSGTLAFQSDVRTASNPNGRVKLYAIDLATGRVATLTRDGEWNDEQPRWSPDGQRIAFRSNRSGSYNLYVMDADGRNLQRLTDHAGNDYDPSWLPDGESVVFASDRDRGAGRYDLYRYWLADGSVERLTTVLTTAMRSCRTPHPMERGSRSSPRRSLTTVDTPTRCTCWNWRRGKPGRSTSRRRVAGRTGRPMASRSRTCRSSTTSRRRSKRFLHSAPIPEPIPGEPARWHYYPDWSPDNRLLAISVSPEHHDGENWDLAILDPSRATPMRRLTTGDGNDRLPDWKPR